MPFSSPTYSKIEKNSSRNAREAKKFVRAVASLCVTVCRFGNTVSRSSRQAKTEHPAFSFTRHFRERYTPAGRNILAAIYETRKGSIIPPTPFINRYARKTPPATTKTSFKSHSPE